jgi:IS1 family transposase
LPQHGRQSHHFQCAGWKRDSRHATLLIDDLKARLSNRVQITTDGLKAYAEAVEGAFGADVNFAMLVKLYGEPKTEGPERKYSPSECLETRTHIMAGNPDEEHISTSHVERQNLTMRMHMRRFTRLTNGFSKKLENHICMVAIYTVYYN